MISLDKYPRRRESVTAYDVQSQTVLHDKSTQQMIALNATGRIIWELCDGATSISEMIGEIQERFDADQRELASDILALLRDLVEQKVLDLASGPKNESAGLVTETHVGFQSCSVLVRTDIPELIEWLNRRFSSMITDTPGRRMGQISISRLGGKYHVSGCRWVRQPVESVYDVRRGVKHEIDRLLRDGYPNLIWFHAGGVSRNSEAILFCGAFGVGKSTLAMKLYERGWDYKSDDIIPYDPDSRSMLAFPLTPMYRVYDEEKNTLNLEPDVSSMHRVWVDVEEDRIDRNSSSIKGIVFPRYTADEEATMTELSPAEALMEMADHCLSYRTHGRGALKHVSLLLENKPMFRLLFNDAEKAADLVEQHLG